jgi:hypothetical protein
LNSYLILSILMKEHNMNSGKTVFSQIMSYLPKYEFLKIVTKYKGDYKSQTFKCWQQFLAMSFAQLTYRESLKDIEICLDAIGNKRYHLGFKHRVPKSTLAYANETTNCQIYADFAQVLIQQALALYKDESELTIDLKNSVYAFDSTTIDLCLSMYPWAHFRKTKSGIKLHTLLDLKCSIPTCIVITDALTHDVNILDQIPIEPGAFYITDRAYNDFSKLYQIHKQSAYYIVRAKKNLSFSRIYSRKANRISGVVCDQIINFKGYYSHKEYPVKLRRVKLFDGTKSKSLVLLTNNFDLPAVTIGELYRNRWKIELFFKWIKQHLKIKAFYGTSINAVKTQIWIAVSNYVLIAILKKKLKIEMPLYNILQVLSFSILEKMPVNTMFSKNDYKTLTSKNSNSLILFE